jgi:hypothetical protein
LQLRDLHRTDIRSIYVAMQQRRSSIMFRLIALYIHYRDLQEQRTRGGVSAAAPTMRIVPAASVKADNAQTVHALAA